MAQVQELQRSSEELTGSDAGPSQAELIERVRVLTAKAEKRAADTEGERKISEEAVAELLEADLTRVCQPAAWGGLQRSAGEFYELAYEMARGCGSTGWSYCVLTGHAMAMLDFPESAQAAVWKDDPTAMLSSAFAPTLKGELVDGGFKVSGACPFSSGSDYASWALLGGLVSEGSGPPAAKLFLVPRSDYELVDDWFVLGLEGSGSKTVRLDAVFVPEDRVIDLPDFFAGIAPFGLQAVMVGTARGGIDSFVETIRNKPGKFGAPPPAESELYQSAIGAAVGDVTFAWELLQKITREGEEILMRGEAVSPEQIGRNRAAASLISRLCLGAVECVFELSGGSGVYDGRLSRALRDVRTAANHAALNSTMAAKDAGAILLGNR